MSNDDHRVALVGCGAMARAWVDATLHAPDTRLVALVDLNREAAEAAAARAGLGGAIVFDSLGSALDATEPTVVFDVTVPEAHDAVATEALRHGCHVLSEKPLAVSVGRARAVMHEARQAGRLHAVMQNRRYLPPIRAVRRLLAAGALGGVQEIHADFFRGPHFGGFRDKMDFPLLLDMAIHTFDAARYLGNVDPVSVYCHSFNPVRSWYGGDGCAIATFEMTKGVVFSYRGSWCAEGCSTTWDSGWRVVAERGSVTWDGAEDICAQRVTGDEGFERATETLDVAIEAMAATGHEACIHDFLRCVRDKERPLTAAEDNIKSLAMVAAAVESAQARARVEVAI